MMVASCQAGRVSRSANGWRVVLFALTFSLSLPGGVQAQGDILDEGAPALLTTAARVPLSLQLGGENLFARRVGLRLGGSLYPLPLVLDRELNLDAFADLTYTLRGGAGGRLARASAAFYLGAGPRYRLINSDLFLVGEPPGTYVGVGGVAGAEFDLSAIGFSLLNAFVEGGGDYIWQLGEDPGAGHLSPRVRLGFGIPFFSTY